MFGINRNLHVKNQNFALHRKRQREAVYADPPTQVPIFDKRNNYRTPSLHSTQGLSDVGHSRPQANEGCFNKQQILRSQSNTMNIENSNCYNVLDARISNVQMHHSRDKENRFNNTAPFGETRKSLYSSGSNVAIQEEKQAVIVKKRPAVAVPKIITTSIQGLNVWAEYLNNTPVIYEICGTLESTIPVHHLKADKSFTIKDGSGKISCVFWEIDRKLEQIPRGTILRCVGRLLGEKFQCISVRRTKNGETQLLQYLVNKCESAFQEIVRQNEM